MTHPAGFSSAPTQAGQQVVAILSVDTINMKAVGQTPQDSQIPIDLRYYVGAVHVIPCKGDQWMVRRFGPGWILVSQLPFSTTELLTAADNPVQGLTQVGSTNPNGENPLYLTGSSITLKTPYFQLGDTWYRDNAGVFEKSTNKGTTWIPVAAGSVSVNVDWTDITSKPSTFPPTVPIHWGDVDAKPSTFPPTPPTGTPDGTKFWRDDDTWATPPGTGAGAGDAHITYGEVPTGTINGSNVVFNLSQNITTGSTMVYRNGIRQKLGTDYTESGVHEITFSDAPVGGDVIEVDYVADGAPDALIPGEVPTGTRNGINTTFTLIHTFAASTTAVFRNGIREQINVSYTESAPNTIVFSSPPLSTDLVQVDYLLPA